MAEGDTPMDKWERTVVVDGFDPSITMDIIELLFEDADETGGGDIEEIAIEEEGKATIVFADKSVADRVLNRRHTVNETAVTVSRLPRPAAQALPTPPISSTVEVHGLKPILTAKILKSFFSNTKRSEGGPIESLDIYQEQGMAMITFCDSEDAVRVAETGLFTLGGCELVVQMTQMTMEKSDVLNSSDMSNSMSSNDTSSLNVTQGENTEPQESRDVQSIPVQKPPQSCPDRDQYLSTQTHANAESFRESNHSTNCTDEPLLARMSRLSLVGEQQSINAAKGYAQQKEVYNPESDVQPPKLTDESIAREHHRVSTPCSIDGGSQKDHSFQTTSYNAEQRSFPSPQSAPQKMISKEEREYKDQYVVEAIDIPQGTHKQLLSLLFSSKRDSGGGEIAALEYDQDAAFARITYKKEEDADEVLNRGKLSFGDALITVRKPSPPTKTEIHRSEQTWDRQSDVKPNIASTGHNHPPDVVVKIRGIPRNTTVQMLSLFLESKKVSGGGKLRGLEYNKDGSAVAVFERIEDAFEVTNRRTLSFGGASLTAEIVPPQIPSGKTVEAQKAEIPVRQTAMPPMSAIHVTGIPLQSTRDFVKLFFENKRVSGGGPVKNVEYILGSKEAVITFEQAADAERVAETLPQIDGSILNINILDTRASNEIPCALLIRGICPTVTKQTLELYFESGRISGGKGIDAIEFDAEKRTAVITYHDPAVVETVLTKQGLKLGDKTLSVSRLQPAPLVPYVHGDTAELKAIIVAGIPTKCTKPELTAFIEKHSQTEVSNVVYGVQVPYVVLVVLKQNVDFRIVQQACARYPLRGAMVSVQQVEMFDSIQVHGVKAMTRQSLELYFESTRMSGGGPIKEINGRQDEDCFTIQFENTKTFHAVMKRQHKYEGRDLNIRPYIPSLGILSLGHSTSAPPVLILAPISIERIDPHIIEFWLKSEESRKSIEQDLMQVGCIVHWPRTSAETLRLECSLQQDDPNFHKLSKEWSRIVKTQFIQTADMFEAKEISVNQASWDVIIRMLKSQKLTNLECMIDRTRYLVLLIGRKKSVNGVIESINKQEAELGIKRKSATEK